MHSREEKLAAFGRLLDVLDTLREKCPWDRKQTNQSLRPNTIEETYELCDAIVNDDKLNICKELGDVLLHVLFYAKIGSETNDFDIADVCNKLCDKLIYRHPHIYGSAQADNAEAVLENWELLKMKEKDGNKTVLSGVPDALPSLIKAYRIQDKARNVGFDWEERNQVWDKVNEEFKELQAELNDYAARKEELEKEGVEDDSAQMQELKNAALAEYGDLIFSVVNAGRLYHLNPDTALEMTNKKFIRRFGYLEQKTIKQGRNLKEMTLGEMDALWNEAKELERQGKL